MCAAGERDEERETGCWGLWGGGGEKGYGYCVYVAGGGGGEAGTVYVCCRGEEPEEREVGGGAEGVGALCRGSWERWTGGGGGRRERGGGRGNER